MELGVHELITRGREETAEAAMARTERCVAACEALGYQRYWFAEHHSMPNQLSTQPIVSAAYFLGKTKKMRIGTGGTMIMHYSPLEIAEQCKTLSAYAPGRLDIGFGRAPGGTIDDVFALAQGRRRAMGSLYDKMEEILAYLQDEEPTQKMYKEARAVPCQVREPAQPWMLGSTGASARPAAKMGLGYSFARWFARPLAPDLFRDYRARFRPSAFFDQARVSVSYRICVAEDRDRLEVMKKPFDAYFLSFLAGDGQAMPRFEDCKDRVFSAEEQASLQSYYDNHYLIAGTREEVEAILGQEMEQFGIDELMFYVPLVQEEDRLESYRILSELFL